MAIQQLEQFHQRHWRRGLAVFITGERIDPTTEDFPRFTLVEVELSAHGGNKGRIDNSIDLALECRHQMTDAHGFIVAQYCLTTGRAVIATDPGITVDLPFVAVGHVLNVRRKLRTAAYGHLMVTTP
jgi:hypothetical protein